MAAGIAFSQDGIHWKPFERWETSYVSRRRLSQPNPLGSDRPDVSFVHTYRLWQRRWAAGRDRDKGFRGAQHARHDEPQHRRQSSRVAHREAMVFNREGEDEFIRRQIYSMTVWVYEGIYFGLMSVFEYPGNISEGRKLTCCDAMNVT